MDEQTFRIIIRSSGYKDHLIYCSSSWNVEQIKKQIKEKHIATPDAKDQRLIFQGKIMKEEEVLMNLIKTTEDTPVIHLVLSIAAYEKKSSDKASTSTKENRNENVLRHRITSESSTSANVTTSTNFNPGQQYLNSATRQQYEQNWSNIYTQPQSLTYQQYQQAWYQYQTNMENYMRYVNGIQLAERSNQQASNPPADAAEQHPPPPAPPVANEAAAQAEARDWLDLLFSFIRIGLIVSLIYFYSTATRFFFIFFLGLLIYLYQRGFFAVQRRVNLPARRQHETNQDESTTQHDGDDTEQVAEDLPRTPPSRIATVWCFIRTFFTSILPQTPPAIVN